jgi:hypothetical protein
MYHYRDDKAHQYLHTLSRTLLDLFDELEKKARQIFLARLNTHSTLQSQSKPEESNFLPIPFNMFNLVSLLWAVLRLVIAVVVWVISKILEETQGLGITLTDQEILKEQTFWCRVVAKDQTMRPSPA